MINHVRSSSPLAARLLGGCACVVVAASAASAQTSNPPAPAAAKTSPVTSRETKPFAPLRDSTTDTTMTAKAAAAATAPAAVDPASATQPTPGTVGDDYKIASNDLLEVEVFGVKELKRSVRVNSSGFITLPLIGSIQVAGLTGSDAEALIAIEYGKKYLQDPQISVFIKEFTTQRITIDGAVNKPGIYPLNGQITLLRALALGGGSAQLADMEQVMIFRLTPDGKNVVEKYNVDKIRKGEAQDPLLQGEDVVVVNRNSARTALRDSLFRDIIDTLNPFSSSVNNVR